MGKHTLALLLTAAGASIAYTHGVTDMEPVVVVCLVMAVLTL